MCSDNVIDAWSRFKSIFVTVIDNNAPTTGVRIKNRTEPWIDSEISHSINERDKAYQTFKSDKSDQNFIVYKECRNITQTLIYRAKKEYFKAKIESENKDSKSLWQSLTDLGMPSKKVKTSSSTLGLKFDNEVCFDKATCAEKFSEFLYYCGIKVGRKTSKKSQ